jgi:hypothetical protein
MNIAMLHISGGQLGWQEKQKKRGPEQRVAMRQRRDRH